MSDVHYRNTFYHRLRQNIYFIVSILNDMSISTALFMYFIYLLPGDDLKNTHKPYIVTVVCLLSSCFISQHVYACYSAALQQ